MLVEDLVQIGELTSGTMEVVYIVDGLIAFVYCFGDEGAHDDAAIIF